MSLDDAELLKEFVVESQEHLADVENQLLTLESQGENMDVSLVNKVFRAVHSIKGAAGFLGLETLQGLAHREEEVLNKLRNRELRPTSEVINTLLKATDKLKCLMDAIDTSNEQDVSEYMSALEQILNGTASTPSPNVAAAVTGPGTTPDTTSDTTPPTEGVDQPSEISGEALREFLIESYDNLEQLERDLMTLERQLGSPSVINGAFRSIHTIKGTAGFLGYTKLERLTHVAENLLGSVRSGQFGWDTEIGGGLFKMIDKVRELLAVIETSGTEGNVDESELVRLLSSLFDRKSAGPQSPTVPPATNTATNSATTIVAPIVAPVARQPDARASRLMDAVSAGVERVETVGAEFKTVSAAPTTTEVIRAQEDTNQALRSGDSPDAVDGENTLLAERPTPIAVTAASPKAVVPTDSPNTPENSATMAA
ncbi:MAG: Hpt domain-containing protein, partial [Pirellulaceae bacterium]|nr:Hpt domain-containing protein [Pirellulaceae bacterium]